LSVNSDADICVFDPSLYWKVEADNLKSQGKNSPFTGLEMAGKVKYTLVNGQLVYQA
jgi:dihydroorotase